MMRVPGTTASTGIRTSPDAPRTLLRESLYDSDWRRTSVSEWDELTGSDEFAFTPGNSTTYADYDLFDRPHTITAPDAKVTTISYIGDSVKSRTVGVGHSAINGQVSEVSSTTADSNSSHV